MALLDRIHASGELHPDGNPDPHHIPWCPPPLPARACPHSAHRLKGVPREANVALLDRIHASGELALTQTELEGQFTIRLAVGSASTQLRHCRQAWEAIQGAADEVLGSKQ